MKKALVAMLLASAPALAHADCSLYVDQAVMLNSFSAVATDFATQ